MQNEESGNKAKQGPDTGQAGQQGGATPATGGIGMTPGHPIDDVGGAGMGKPPGEGGTATAPQPSEKKAADPQDRSEAGTSGS